jgi:uncharacterized membrane protein
VKIDTKKAKRAFAMLNIIGAPFECANLTTFDFLSLRACAAAAPIMALIRKRLKRFVEDHVN